MRRKTRDAAAPCLCFVRNRTNIGQVSLKIRVDYQRLLIDHLDLIEQIVRTAGRRRHLSGAEQEDFAGFVHLRLIEDDYAVLKKFQGRSTLWTFLVAVIERLSLDFCVERWGRWRPSNMADRLGPVAVLLERLIHRDGHTLDEAMEIVRTDHQAGLTFSELRVLWDQLPIRPRTLEVGEEAAAFVPSPDTPEETIADEARRKNIDRLEQILTPAFKKLPARDRLLIALRFDHGLSIAEVARTVNSTVPTVHRHIDRCLRELRDTLAASGLEPRDIAGLIGHSTVVLSPLLRSEVEKFLKRGRLLKRDG